MPSQHRVGIGVIPDILPVTDGKVGIGDPMTSVPDPNLPIESVSTSA
jgi:hypothetical protein